MKKLIFTCLIMLIASSFSMAQTTITVSGTVTNSANNSPITNQQMTIISIDSMNSFYFYQTVNTNSSGVYSTVIQNYPLGTPITVRTKDCNNIWQYQYPTANSSYIGNFSICFGNPPPACQAAFVAYPDSFNQQTIHFADQTTGNPTSWLWDFGDNTTSTLQNPSHTYSANQYYAVTLTVVCSNTSSTITDTINVGGGTISCQANFTYSANPSNPLNISFTNTSTGNPTSFLWHFGDNTTSTLQNPSHTYAQAGNYNVILDIYSPGCSDSIVTQINVQNSTTCAAQYAAIPDSTNPLMIHFFDQSIGNPTSWLWDFGDNTTSTLQYPSHTYSSSQYYAVSLTIVCSNTTHTITDTILVGGGSTGCQANFTSNPNVVYPKTIYFTDQSTGNPTSWSWDFGDNSTSTVQNPTHIYSQSGSYTVTLSISGSGCQSTTTKTVVVGSNPSNGVIYGQIFAGNMVADYGIVYLIEFNPITNILSAIDTTVIDSNGYYGFTNVLFGTYYVKSALSPNSIYYNSYFPTYYGNQLLWSNATTINLNTTTAVGNINLIAGNNPGGPGFIGGNVLQGANKGPGDPMEGIKVMLFDMSDNPIALDITDVNGSYSFSNLAYGNYKVWIDIPGKTTTPAVVVIDATTPSVNNINMIINSTTIVAGIEKSPSIFDRSVGEIYPNPSFDNSKLEITLLEAMKVEVSVFNSMGQIVRTKTIELSIGKNLVEINSTELDNGIYTIRLESYIGQAYRKFVKVTK